MTEITLGQPTRIPEPMSAWIGRRQQELSARAHAKAYEQARRYGWTVTVTAGRFGFEARSYRDNRFDDRRLQKLACIGHGRPGDESVLTLAVGGPDVTSGHQNDKTTDYLAEGKAGGVMAGPKAADRAALSTSAIARLLASDMREDVLAALREVFEREAVAKRLAYSPEEAAELLGISRYSCTTYCAQASSSRSKQAAVGSSAVIT